MHITGTAKEIVDTLREDNPELRKVMTQAANDVPRLKRQVSPYQGAVIYALAKSFRGRKQPFVLEIGTAWGYSAAFLSQALPEGNIITLNPKWHEIKRARRHLSEYTNVFLVPMKSWDYLATYTGPELTMIFVDGDHMQIRRDLPWWNRLETGGLMLFHDYAPKDSWRPCPPVYEALSDFIEYLGRPPDVSIIDDGDVGMIGFYRREGESYLWQTPRMQPSPS